MLDALKQVNRTILSQARLVPFRVSFDAPSTFKDVIAQSKELCIWQGGSEDTIFDDSRVNWAFRALHDRLHIKTRLGFSINEEIELGRIQASQYSGLMADLVYLEVAGQARQLELTGQFIVDQRKWTLDKLRGMGYKL